jgi:polyribonucleotide nucleotidyltransferase
MIAASAALTLSGVPFMGPIAAARVGYKDGEYQLNPSLDEIKEGELDLAVAGTRDAVLMVESEAKELSEEVMLGAVMFAHEQSKPVIDAIIRLAEQAAKEPWELASDESHGAILDTLRGLAGSGLEQAYKLVGKAERVAAIAAAKSPFKDAFSDADPQTNWAL